MERSLVFIISFILFLLLVVFIVRTVTSYYITLETTKYAELYKKKYDELAVLVGIGIVYNETLFSNITNCNSTEEDLQSVLNRTKEVIKTTNMELPGALEIEIRVYNYSYTVSENNIDKEIQEACVYSVGNVLQNNFVGREVVPFGYGALIIEVRG